MASGDCPSPTELVRIRDPGELIGSLGYLIGFVPVDSVVLVASGPQGRVGKRVRADLPAERDLDRLAAGLVAAIVADRPAEVFILIVGGREPAGGEPPGAGLVRVLRRLLLARGVVAREAYWAAAVAGGQRWRRFDDPGAGGGAASGVGSGADGDLASGVVADPKGTVIAAAFTAAGIVVYGSRQEMEGLFTAGDGALLRQRAELIREAFSRVDAADLGVAELRKALSQGRKSDAPPSESALALIAVALADAVVRDSCLATALPVGSPTALGAERLWQALARSLPAPWRAEAACLAAYSAYMRGDGALAQVAVRVALKADSHHLLANLLARALEKGIDPRRMHRLAAHDELGLCAPMTDAA